MITDCLWPYIPGEDSGELAVSLVEVKEKLRIASEDESQDALITRFIKSVTLYAEKYTGRNLVLRPYTTYRNNFSDFFAWNTDNEELELRKSPLSEITKIEYTNLEGSVILIPEDFYYIKKHTYYGSVIPVGENVWPVDDVSIDQQKVTIEFVAGYGETSDDIPEDMKTAMTEHVGMLYGGAECIAKSVLPMFTKAVYEQYKIYTLV